MGDITSAIGRPNTFGCGKLYILMNNKKEHREETGMADERNISTHLLSINDAIDKVGWLVHRAWKSWQNTLTIQACLRAEEGPQSSNRVQQVLHSRPAKPGV
jgi:hypothetical protein